jgi:predicted NUDIX family NTP pyrophosphohydrolase
MLGAVKKSTSAGLLLFRVQSDGLEVLLVHLGGPYFAKKDAGAWFVPKGEVEDDEELLTAAKREFHEETGFVAKPPFIALGSVRHKSGKVVHVWGFQGDCDPSRIASNTFTMEWPPKSGRRQTFPEIDRAAFYSASEAMEKMHPIELEFLTRLERECRVRGLLSG